MPQGKRYNVCRKDEREVRGEKKTFWPRIGTVFMDGEKDGGKLILDMFGEQYYLFPPKDDAGKKDSGYGG